MPASPSYCFTEMQKDKLSTIKPSHNPRSFNLPVVYRWTKNVDTPLTIFLDLLTALAKEYLTSTLSTHALFSIYINTLLISVYLWPRS